jgi:hypothetical protein
MTTFQVAAKGALPEELLQGMFLTKEVFLLSPEFEGEFFLERQRGGVYFLLHIV